MACSCSKNKQPTGFAAKSTVSAQDAQRSGASSVPGSISARTAPAAPTPPAGSK